MRINCQVSIFLKKDPYDDEEVDLQSQADRCVHITASVHVFTVTAYFVPKQTLYCDSPDYSIKTHDCVISYCRGFSFTVST